MKTRYKIIAIVVCAYFGVFLGPVTASNVYCDFVSQEMCTSRITGVVLPPLNLIMPSLPSDNCIVNNDGVTEPCYNEAGLLEWPFPPRMEVHPERECDEICVDVEKLPPCTSDRTACFNQDANLCDPSGWECGDIENVFDEIIELPKHDESLAILFSPLNLENIELSFDWCTKNNGFWNEDDSTCYFETQKDHDDGIMALDQYTEKTFGVEPPSSRIVSFGDPDYPVPFGSSKKEYNIDPIYIENPNNPGELILDIDSMQLVQEILDYCELPKYKGFAYGLEYSNGTHIIDNNTCEWRKIK